MFFLKVFEVFTKRKFKLKVICKIAHVRVRTVTTQICPHSNVITATISTARIHRLTIRETLPILPFPQILFIGCVTLPPPSYTGATTSADSPDAMRICASFWVTNTDVSVILEGNGICVCVCVCGGSGVCVGGGGGS